MKWAILVGSVDVSGGTYVIFEHAIRALRRGVKVTIVTEAPVIRSQLAWHREAEQLTYKTFDQVRRERFDVAVATWWRTVWELHRVPAKTYAYFVQSIESRFYDESERPLRKLVDSTYMLPLSVITEASWIQAHLAEHYDRPASLVLNGIRKDIYQPEGEAYSPREPGRLRVLVEGPLGVPFKNVERTIALCRQSEADEVWLMTSTPLTNHPNCDRTYSRISIFDTAKVYRSCDLIVKLSYVEGMFGPPLEMFHCGGTAIIYDVTGAEEYIRHNQNAFVAAVDDDAAVVAYINELKGDPARLDALKRAALATAADWPDWDDASLAFQQTLTAVAKSAAVSQAELKRKSAFLFHWYEIAEQYRLSLNGNGTPHLHAKPNPLYDKAKRVMAEHFPGTFESLRRLKHRAALWIRAQRQ